MTLREYLNWQTLKMSGGYVNVEDLPKKAEKLTFINDIEMINLSKLREYAVWYQGDAMELLNFYTYEIAVTTNTEIWAERNQKNMFWGISATEQDIKRTHSGQAKNIIDTLTSIISTPDCMAGSSEMGKDNPNNIKLQNILEENQFWELYKMTQVPMTLVEGWGAYKIWWDDSISDYPIIDYYRAEDVELVYSRRRLVGMIFKDYYTNGNKKYMIAECRYIKDKKLYIHTEVFDISAGDASLDSFCKKIDKDKLPEGLKIDIEDTEAAINKLLAVPCIFYKDASGFLPGRSVLAGKIELLDDLDQCLSQASNTVRKSTPVEYINSNFLERDRKTGLPIQPKAYDRKYVTFKGAKTSDGTDVGGSAPVFVTQPTLNFEQYDNEATAILLQIMNGLISPATLGMDIAKKDNAEAQREKEKITIFTRNNICSTEVNILRSLFNQVMIADEIMRTNKVTCFDYSITVDYPEFGDSNFETKIALLGDQLDKDNISVDMYLKQLYGNKFVNTEDWKQEKKYLEERHKPAEEDEGEDEDVFGEQKVNNQINETDDVLQEPFEEQGLASSED